MFLTCLIIKIRLTGAILLHKIYFYFWYFKNIFLITLLYLKCHYECRIFFCWCNGVFSCHWFYYFDSSKGSILLPPLPYNEKLVKQSCHLVDERSYYKRWILSLGSHTRLNLHYNAEIYVLWKCIDLAWNHSLPNWGCTIYSQRCRLCGRAFLQASLRSQVLFNRVVLWALVWSR